MLLFPDFQPKSVVFNVKQAWKEHTGRWHCCSSCSGSEGDSCTYGAYTTGMITQIHTFSDYILSILEHWKILARVMSYLFRKYIQYEWNIDTFLD